MPGFRPADRDPAHSDAEARARFLRFLGKSLSTVHRNAVWRIAARGDNLAAVTVPDVVPLLTTAGDKLFLRSTIAFEYSDHERFPGERKVSTVEYAHTVGCAESLKPQLYSWEWAPQKPHYPHVHVRRADPKFGGLGKLHIPTGRVFFEHVLLFLINEHGVVPVVDDWEDKLGDSLRRVSSFSTWGRLER